MLLKRKQLSKWYLLMLLGTGALGTSTMLAANDINLNLLTEINTDRETVVRRYAETWEIESGEEQNTLLTAFNEANTKQLLDIDQAASFDDVRAILLGSSNSSNLAAKGVAQKLGDTAQDLVYTPVVPCRIIDTRSGTGVLAANTSRDFKAYGNAATITAQGGNVAGCTSPRGEPAAVHMNVVAVPFGPEQKGNIRAFPTGEAEPQSALVNFTMGTNIANAATIKNCRFCADGGDDFTLKANFSGAHVVVDVLGYYYPVNTIVDTDRLALGFASYRADGVKLSGTENMENATYSGNSFKVPINGETYSASTHTVSVTVDTSASLNCRDNLPSVDHITSGADEGKLEISFFDVEGVQTGDYQQCNFHVSVYKNNSLIIFIPPIIVLPPLGG